MTPENLKVLPSSPFSNQGEGVPDPFDLKSLALGQDFAESVGVRRLA